MWRLYQIDAHKPVNSKEIVYFYARSVSNKQYCDIYLDTMVTPNAVKKLKNELENLRETNIDEWIIVFASDEWESILRSGFEKWNWYKEKIYFEEEACPGTTKYLNDARNRYGDNIKIVKCFKSKSHPENSLR